MRSLTCLLRVPDGSHPAYSLFEADSEFRREAIYHLNVLADGTVALLGRLRGDLDRAEAAVESKPEILEFSLSRLDDGSGLAYVHARPPSAVKRLLELPRDHEVFFEYPIEGTADGGLRVVVIGETNETLREVLAAVPEAINVTVERVGPYPADDLAALLTDRQREVLSVASDLGYYDVPRRATHADVAEALGLSVGTVGEHLQKVEARVFDSLVR